MVVKGHVLFCFHQAETYYMNIGTIHTVYASIHI